MRILYTKFIDYAKINEPSKKPNTLVGFFTWLRGMELRTFNRVSTLLRFAVTPCGETTVFPTPFVFKSIFGSGGWIRTIDFLLQRQASYR